MIWRRMLSPGMIREWSRVPLCSRILSEAADNPKSRCSSVSLTFLDLQAIFEEEHEWCDAVLTEVQQTDHAFCVHGLSRVELIVLEVRQDLLHLFLGASHEGFYSFWVALRQLTLDRLHVFLDVSDEAGLVEARLSQLVVEDDVYSTDRGGLQVFTPLLLGLVGSQEGAVDVLRPADHLALDFDDDSVVFDLVDVREHLITADDVLVDDHFAVVLGLVSGGERSVAAP